MRILVILLARLGDMIQATPCLAALPTRWPEASIDLIALDEAAAVLPGLPLAQVWPLPGRHLPMLDREVLDHCRRGATPPLARQVLDALQLPRYQHVVNLDYGPLAGWLTANVAAEGRQGGLVTAEGRRLYLGAWHSYIFAEIAARDANLFNLSDLWRAAVGDGPPLPESRPHVPVAPSLPFPLPPGRRIALNPGAAEPWRRWPAACFTALAARLRAAGWTPMLTGSPADAELCAAIARDSSFPLENFAGRTSVAEMAALLRQCELLVSNDTGAVHIAAAAGTRVLGLYGAIPYFRMTAPWSQGNLILRQPGHARPDENGDAPAAPPLPVDLVELAVRERMGAAPEPELAALLNAHRIEAWESRFLPVDADPLGGLAWRPLHDEAVTAETLFRLALRSAFATKLSENGAPAMASAAPPLALWPGGRLPDDWAAQHTALATDARALLQHWENWGARARRLRGQTPRETPEARRKALLLLAQTEELPLPRRESLCLLATLLLRRASFLVTQPLHSMLAGFEQECRLASDIVSTALRQVEPHCACPQGW